MDRLDSGRQCSYVIGHQRGRSTQPSLRASARRGSPRFFAFFHLSPKQKLLTGNTRADPLAPAPRLRDPLFDAAGMFSLGAPVAHEDPDRPRRSSFETPPPSPNFSSGFIANAKRCFSEHRLSVSMPNVLSLPTLPTLRSLGSDVKLPRFFSGPEHLTHQAQTIAPSNHREVRFLRLFPSSLGGSGIAGAGVTSAL